MKALELDGRREQRYTAIIEEGWERIVAKGTIAYDPIEARTFQHGRFCFHYLPGRSNRPGAKTGNTSPGGLLTPHRPCPFDNLYDVCSREVLRFSSAKQLYHLIANRWRSVSGETSGKS